LKAIHNELPAAAHGEGRNASCPRATFVAGAGQPGYWIPATLDVFRSQCGRKSSIRRGLRLSMHLAFQSNWKRKAGRMMPEERFA
jgi:hypothetical protein